MCNRFNVKTEPASLATLFDAILRGPLEQAEEVFPGSTTMTMAVNRNEQREVLPMRFGLVPFGKDASNQKYPLTNARVENLDKWPWKRSIESHRCVVPMTSFREPCYWGEGAGTEVDFVHQDDSPMLAAAIFSWSKPIEVGDVADVADVSFTMSLIMRPALPVVMKQGHHRSPFFLNADGINAWTKRESRTIEESRDVLAKHSMEPELRVSLARTMASTWKKRQAGHLQKRDAQIASIQETGPLGFVSSSQ